jgi:hypothetical protein
MPKRYYLVNKRNKKKSQMGGNNDKLILAHETSLENLNDILQNGLINRNLRRVNGNPAEQEKEARYAVTELINNPTFPNDIRRSSLNWFWVVSPNSDNKDIQKTIDSYSRLPQIVRSKQALLIFEIDAKDDLLTKPFIGFGDLTFNDDKETVIKQYPQLKDVESHTYKGYFSFYHKAKEEEQQKDLQTLITGHPFHVIAVTPKTLLPSYIKKVYLSIPNNDELKKLVAMYPHIQFKEVTIN